MKRGVLLMVGLMMIAFLSCKKKGCTDPQAINFSEEAKKDDGSCTYESPTYLSTFTFKHQVNGQVFLFDTILYNHPAGYTFSIETLKYFISDIVLHKTNGDSVYLNMAHYVDAEDNTTSTYSYVGQIDNGTYNAISFVFGLDENKNVTGIYNNPPESLMEWPVPMGGGYHYLKLEGKYDSLGIIQSYNTHYGALMGAPYYFVANMPYSFSITDNTIDAAVLMEITNWYQDPILYDFGMYGAAIMGNANAQATLQSNGYNVFELESVN